MVNEILFKGKRSINWNDVENYVRKYHGNKVKIISSNEEIQIDSKFADEFCWSNDSKRLRGALAKAKANASQVIIELIQNAGNMRYQENLDEKHKSNAKYGWYRYTCRFMLPVYKEDGSIERYNCFRIEMVVRHASDNKKYLYDFVNIKKETSKPL